MAFVTSAFATYEGQYYDYDTQGILALGIDSHPCDRIERWRAETAATDPTNALRAMAEIYVKATGLPLVTAEDRHRFKHWVEDRCPDKGRFYE